MIDAADIQELLQKEPFATFRIQMTDGKSYEVSTPGLCVAMENNFFLALPKGRWKLLAYENMTSIDADDAPSRAARTRR